MKNNDGGPAFPRPVSSIGNVGGFEPEFSSDQQGMSLRDYFAARAMEKITNVRMSFEETAQWAYKMADAMLKAREE